MPTRDQLNDLSTELEFDVEFEQRILGGLGCTSDVLTGRGRRWVLRRHGPWWNERNPQVALKEHAVHVMVKENGIPAPDIVWAAEPGIFETPALVMEHVDGQDLLIPEDPIDAGRQLAQALDAIHAAVPDQATRTLLETSTSPDGDRPEGFYDHPDAERVTSRHESLRPPSPRAALIHGDFWPGNTMWKAGKLIAVLDWEEATLGDPMNDVAYCALDLRYLGLDAAATAFLHTYFSASGRESDTLAYWTLFALSRPMPDITQWLPAWEAKGITHISADALRARHQELLEDALG